MGLSRFDVVVMDEPGSLDERNGTLLWRAVTESLGKLPGQKVLAIGTRAPADPGNWWPKLLGRGSGPGVHVKVLAADPDEPWDSWNTVRKCNPLLNVSATLRRTVLRERDAARKDHALERSYRAYRLNQIVDVSASPLLPAEHWLVVEGRDVEDREGDPVVGLDAGGARAWSAAVALWPNGRDALGDLKTAIKDLAGRVLVAESQRRNWNDAEAGGARSEDWRPQRLGANPPEGLVKLFVEHRRAVLAACGVPPELLGGGEGTGGPGLPSRGLRGLNRGADREARLRGLARRGFAAR
ncbi:hypothetical protein [Candidatus Palauibacter sp.]|uniref:hypothetical protein n=1 Tax=Candidatus Palauibacter sp. TaxID=3101350 RepID=UPI003AF2AE68